jgi:CheY-like chemotaxis protein
MYALIADDDELNRDMLDRMLRRLGWSVDTASDGSQAIAACQASHYDVVLLDIRMPGMQGFEVARHIRLAHATSGSPSPRLVAVTGTDRLEDAGFNLFDGYLQKPFMLSELQACLTDNQTAQQ